MNRRFYAILANLLMLLGGLSTDIYLPSLPQMAHSFSSDDASVQLTITAYVLAMGLAQLAAGPVSDALGRRKLILTSLFTQLIAILTIIHANSVDTIIAMRFIQGFAVAFMLVPARAILNDLFEGAQLKKQFNYLTLSFAISPIIAPLIGGYCEHYFGWQASFYFLLSYLSFVLLINLGFSRETMLKTHTFSFQNLLHNYKMISKTKAFTLPTLFLGTLIGYTSLLNVLGPFILQTQLNLTPLAYGYVALLAGFSWFLGNLSNQLLFEVDNHKKVVACLNIQSLMVALLFLFAYFEIITVAWILIPILFLVFTVGIIFPIILGECLSLFPQLAATSNAFLFAICWVAFACYTLLATQMPSDTLAPLSLAFFLVHLSSRGLYRRIIKLSIK